MQLIDQLRENKLKNKVNYVTIKVLNIHKCPKYLAMLIKDDITFAYRTTNNEMVHVYKYRKKQHKNISYCCMTFQKLFGEEVVASFSSFPNRCIQQILTNVRPIYLPNHYYHEISRCASIKKSILINEPSVTDVCQDLLNKVQKYHPSAVYHGSSNIYHQFTYTNSKEICPVGNKKHSSKKFYVIENDRGYYLKCPFCKKSLHIGYPDETVEFIQSGVQINKKYLIEGEIDEKPNEEIKDFIKNWLLTNIKTLAIRSAMGTGKTTMIKKILEYDGSLKKILWITHRQTLTKSIYGNFKEFGFINYLDTEGNLLNYPRVIVQIDSLMRISGEDENHIPTVEKYDLVIIDESESALSHFSSPFLNKPNQSSRELFQFMSDVVESANKLLLLDADLGMRTNLFMKHFGEYIFINNIFKSTKKTFCITNDYDSFDSKLFADIKANKNICVVSMSASALESIVVTLKKNKINYIMHSSKTDDILKNELEDVNSFWIKYQCVLYSPTIESGIDFNQKYFDKIYAIIKPGQLTTSQRGFLQMIGRIRFVVNSKILCYYGGPIKSDKSNKSSIPLNSRIYLYNDVLNYFQHYETLNGKRILEYFSYRKEEVNGQIKFIREPSKISVFDSISLYNETEILNKNPSIFMTILNKLILKNGDHLEFALVDKTVKNKIDKENISDILSEIDETEYNIVKLIQKQNKSKLNKEEKLVLRKYFFMKKFAVHSSENKEQFVEYHEICSKINSGFSRCLKLFEQKNNDIGIEIDDDFESACIVEDNDDEIDNFNDGKDKSRHIMIFNFLDIILQKNKEKYSMDEIIDIKFSNDEFNDAIDRIVNESIYFNDEEKNRALFFKSKGKLTELNDKTRKHYVNTIISILKLYGINLNTSGRIRVNGKRECVYSLSVDELIRDIINVRNGQPHNLKQFNDLFKK